MIDETIDRGRELELARAVDAAVGQLWSAGNLAMALRLLLEDGERLLRALRGMPEAEAEATALEALLRAGTKLGVPVLDRELTPAHRELLAWLADGRRICMAKLRGSPLRSKRARRSGAIVLGLLLALVAFQMCRNVSTAHASATYSSDFPARFTLDGLTKTEWLLPQEKKGWLELAFTRPRTVESLRIRNACNGSYRDRATKAFKVEAFSKTKVVATAEGEFPPIADDKGPLTIPLSAREVTHVRITVKSFYGAGAGLAEVEVH